MADVRRNITSNSMDTKETKKFMVIHAKSGKIRGLLSIFIQVINNLKYCDENNIVPVIDLKGRKYWLFDSDIEGDIWEYYFYPISEYNVSTIDEKECDFTTFLLPVNASAGPISEEEKNWVYSFLDNRKYYNKTILSHIKIKEHIIKAVDSFYNNNMKGENILGVQIRGTDTVKIAVPINDYIQEINSYLKDHDITKIYVSSDTHEALGVVKDHFPNLIIFYNCIRQSKFNGKKIHGGDWKKLGFKSPKDVGDEALIETLLLSKCSHIIYSKSSIAVAALMFNPQMSHTYLKRPTE